MAAMAGDGDDGAVDGWQPLPLLDFPREVQLLIVGKLDGRRAWRSAFATCHAMRRLVLECSPIVTVSLWPHAAAEPQPKLGVVAQLLESPIPVRALRVSRDPKAHSFVPFLGGALAASQAPALELWNAGLSNDEAAAVAGSACGSLRSLTVDVSSCAPPFMALLAGSTHLTRLEMQFGTAGECLVPLADALPSLPSLQELVVHGMYAEPAWLKAPVLKRITELGVDVGAGSEQEFAVASSPWVVALLERPQEFGRLRCLQLVGDVPWLGLQALLGLLPGLTRVQVRRLVPPSDGRAAEPPAHMALQEVEVVRLLCPSVLALQAFFRQVPALRVETLLLPDAATTGGEAAAVRQLAEAAAVLGAVRSVSGTAPAHAKSAYKRCIDLEGLPALLPLPGLASALGPMAHHLGAVSLEASGVPALTPQTSAAVAQALGPHTHTLNVGGAAVDAADLWAWAQALPNLRLLCFCLGKFPGTGAAVRGFIAACEAAGRPMVLQVVRGYGTPAVLEAEADPVAAGCGDWTRVELRDFI